MSWQKRELCKAEEILRWRYCLKPGAARFRSPILKEFNTVSIDPVGVI